MSPCKKGRPGRAHLFKLARENINRAFDIVAGYDSEQMALIRLDEDALDTMADRVSGYLMQISAHITTDEQTEIMNHYYSTISEFERLGDHAMNIAEDAEEMYKAEVTFSETALKELGVVRDLLRAVLNYTGKSFPLASYESSGYPTFSPTLDLPLEKPICRSGSNS